MQKILKTLITICLIPLLLTGQEKVNQGNNGLVISENTFLSTDKDFYLTGEKIWFSATLSIAGKTSSPDFSQVLYVELISLNQSQDIMSKHQISDGKVNGLLDIPEGLSTGYYVLRAYTTYKRNEGPSSFSSKVLTIVNPVIPLVKNANKDELQIEVFSLDDDAEKRDLGLLIPPSQLRKNPTLWVGFKDTSLVYPVRYFENGLAYFQMNKSNSHLSPSIFFSQEKDTISKSITFPAKEKIYLSFEQLGNSIRIDGSMNEDIRQSSTSLKLYILNANQKILHSSEVEIKNGKFNFNFANQKMTDGLYYVVLNGVEGDFVSTDAFYFKKAGKEIMRISTDQENYASRAPVTMNIMLLADNDEIDNYSVSVATKGSVDAKKNVPLYLIKNPLLFNSFLQNTKLEEKTIEKQMEILLAWYSQSLTLSPDVLKGASNQASEQFYVEARGVNLNGTVRHKKSKLPAKGIDVYLSVFGDKPQLQIYTTEADGAFRFSLRHIKDLTNIYLVFDAPGEQDDLEMLVNRDYSNLFPAYTKLAYSPDTSIKKFIDEAYINAQVAENYQDQVTITSKKTMAFRFHEPASTILLDDYVPMKSLESVINELVPFTKVKREDKKAYLEVLDGLTNLAYHRPLILLDDLPVFDVDELLRIHPVKVEKVSVINSTYIYGDHILKGIVMIDTKTENFGGFALPHYFTAIEYNATSSQSSFVPIVYNESVKISERIPDFRNLLFWKPQIGQISKDTSFTFYTSDHKGDYQIVINGILKNGQPFSLQTDFSVE